jgi:hypothetical protein
MTKKEKSFPNVLIGNPEKQIEYLGACSEVVYFADDFFSFFIPAISLSFQLNLNRCCAVMLLKFNEYCFHPGFGKRTRILWIDLSPTHHRLIFDVSGYSAPEYILCNGKNNCCISLI